MFINIYNLLSINKEFKTLNKAPIKQDALGISIMNSNTCFVFFTLLSSCCFSSALKCYLCKDPSTDPGNCSSVKYLDTWEIDECSGSCYQGWGKKALGKPFRYRFVNPTGKVLSSQGTSIKNPAKK